MSLLIFGNFGVGFFAAEMSLGNFQKHGFNTLSEIVVMMMFSH